MSPVHLSSPSNVLPFITQDMSTAEKSAILETPVQDLEFTVEYWDISSVGSTAREILAYGNANWKNRIPDDEVWDKGESPTPFRCLPVLHLRRLSDGKETHLSESSIVDIYLAEKFNLLGTNPYESKIIQSFYSSISFLRLRGTTRDAYKHPSIRQQSMDQFLTEMVPVFITHHETHLRANGSNGHYVGDCLSLADIHLSNMMDHFMTEPMADRILPLFKKSSLMWKVKEKVEQVEGIRAWRETKEARRLFRNSMEHYHDDCVPGQEERTPFARLRRLEAQVQAKVEAEKEGMKKGGVDVEVEALAALVKEL